MIFDDGIKKSADMSIFEKGWVSDFFVFRKYIVGSMSVPNLIAS